MPMSSIFNKWQGAQRRLKPFLTKDHCARRGLRASTPPGEGRIAACLAANRSSVSASCVDAVGKLNIK
jgi:hypothetical protein